MGDALAGGRVDHADGHLDQADAGGDGAQDDLGLEGVAVVAAAEGEARRRLAAVGPNRLVELERWAWLKEALRLVGDPMALMLAVAGALYLVLGQTRDGVVLLVALAPGVRRRMQWIFESKRVVKEYLATPYVEFIGKEVQTAYLESYSEYGQNIFDRYVTFADLWIQDQEYRDPNTGEILDRAALNDELEKIEKPAGISNPKDFRHEIVNFVLRARAANHGKNPSWTSYEKLRTVIEKKMFSTTEDLLPVISFNAKASDEERKKHQNFVDRMVAKGYTPKQVRLLVEWYLRVRKSS